MVEIQVKTASGRGEETNWPVGAKAQAFAESDDEWFIFVLLPKVPQVPRSFVVPRDHVSAAAWISHEDWRTDPSAPAGKRNAGVDRARVLVRVWSGYEDRWDLLDAPTTAAPVLLPTSYYRLALDERVGLPPGHPWIGHLPRW
ncbi:MAG TPA: hypothetical protein VKV02_01010 [Acidobacteriaceae bacterium]|nr:hypothetical protein [Acidobacteriaceae bacterium]